ncbi:MAG: hypothetical protein EBS05_22380 [Proteobacteria bacterium]|nr:hypothetical protein [Pseudomonadota bacterium]
MTIRPLQLRAGANKPAPSVSPIAHPQRKFDMMALMEWEAHLAAQINARPGGAAALGVIDGAADTAPGFKNWKHSHARISALEAQLAKLPATIPSVPAGTSPGIKATPPVPSAVSQKPAVVAHTVTTDQLECLAVEIFGRAALPKIDTMPDHEKRTAIMRDLWQAHVTVPGLKIEAQPGWYRVENLDRVCQTIAAYRQAKVHEFLAVTPPPPASSAMDRAAFNQLSPLAQLEHCRNGGRIID